MHLLKTKKSDNVTQQKQKRVVKKGHIIMSHKSQVHERKINPLARNYKKNICIHIWLKFSTRQILESHYRTFLSKIIPTKTGGASSCPSSFQNFTFRKNISALPLGTSPRSAITKSCIKKHFPSPDTITTYVK